MILQIGTALAVGVYVVLSRDAQPKRSGAIPREWLQLQHPPDHLDRDGRPELSAMQLHSPHRGVAPKEMAWAGRIVRLMPPICENTNSTGRR